MLNSKNIQDKLAASGGNAAKLSSQEERSDGERVAELYRKAFARDPLEDELKVSISYLEKKRAEAEAKKEDVKAAGKMAYEDLVWALLNTKEFLFNH